MNKSTVVILVIAFIVCLGFVGATGYYIGSKSSSIPTQSGKTVITSIDDVPEEIKEQIKEELREELTKEISSNLTKEYNQKYKSEDTSAENTTTENVNTTTTSVAPANNTSGSYSGKPFIKVHDVTASMADGAEGIETAIKSAVDDSSDTAMADIDAIDGIGKFPIYWTSVDGATATSYITITE